MHNPTYAMFFMLVFFYYNYEIATAISIANIIR
ncbi:hypothetical protein DSUL_100077 [Desulfovibrionales bacterium]